MTDDGFGLFHISTAYVLRTRPTWTRTSNPSSVIGRDGARKTGQDRGVVRSGDPGFFGQGVGQDGGLNDRERRIALLVDADDAPAAKIDLILTESPGTAPRTSGGPTATGRAPHLKSWEAVLHTRAIRPIQQFAHSVGKNASDMATVVDAMDLLHARKPRRVRGGLR